MLQKFLIGNSDWIELLIFIPIFLFTLTIHELMHGFVAYKLGDNTAKNAGRLTFNPFSHLDLIGTLMILFLGFGWAKPVPVNPYNFNKKIPMKYQMALVSISGSMANFILALLGMFLIRYTHHFPIAAVAKNSIRDVTSLLVNLNVVLGVFNLLPIPPLDGGEILKLFLSERWYYIVSKNEQFGFLIILALVFFPISNTFLNWLINFAYQCLSWFINLFPG